MGSAAVAVASWRAKGAGEQDAAGGPPEQAERDLLPYQRVHVKQKQPFRVGVPDAWGLLLRKPYSRGSHPRYSITDSLDADSHLVKESSRCAT